MRYALAAVAVVAFLPDCGITDTPRKPNIIFILADDLGYGDLSCYGQKVLRTPNIDRLAEEGTRFTDFYAGSTVCAPSRCVLMTGLHTGHCFIRGNAKMNLRPEDVTVAKVLKQAGYATACIGKWGLGHEGSTGVPTKQGFDYFFGYLDQHHAHNYYPSFLIRNESRVKLPNVVPNEGKYGQGVATKRVVYSHDLFTEEAIKFIRQNRDRPFFLYLAYTIPHANNEAGNRGMEVPDLGEFKDKPWPEPEKGFAAMLARLDRDVGRILRLLKELGIDEQTIVFFSSDNGPHREGGHDPDFFDSNGPLRGIKRDMYEGGIRMPFLVRWPGHVPAGKVSHFVGWFADFLPTAAAIAGVKPPENVDGINILPVLLGQEMERPADRYLYWEFYERGFSQAVRQGKWKAVRNHSKDAPIELYDLSRDVGETQNVAKQHPEIVKKMAELMEKAHLPSPYWKPRPWRPRRQLKPRR